MLRCRYLLRLMLFMMPLLLYCCHAVAAMPQDAMMPLPMPYAYCPRCAIDDAVTMLIAIHARYYAAMLICDDTPLSCRHYSYAVAMPRFFAAYFSLRYAAMPPAFFLLAIRCCRRLRLLLPLLCCHIMLLIVYVYHILQRVSRHAAITRHAAYAAIISPCALLFTLILCC